MCVCYLQNSIWQNVHTAVCDWPSVFYLLYIKLNALDISHLIQEQPCRYLFQLFSVYLCYDLLKHKWKCFCCLFQSVCQVLCNQSIYFWKFCLFCFKLATVIWHGRNSIRGEGIRFCTEINTYTSMAPTLYKLTQTAKMVFQDIHRFFAIHV